MIQRNYRYRFPQKSCNKNARVCHYEADAEEAAAPHFGLTLQPRSASLIKFQHQYLKGLVLTPFKQTFKGRSLQRQSKIEHWNHSSSSDIEVSIERFMMHSGSLRPFLGQGGH